MNYRCLSLALAVLASPSFALQQGDTVPGTVISQLGIAPGKITVVDFFAEWCESCRKELPLISALANRSDKAQIEFVGVDTDEDLAIGQAFQTEMKAQRALSFRVIDDPQQTLVNVFKPRGYPALYLLQNGKIVAEHLGATPDIDATIAQDLQRLGTAPLAANVTAEGQ